MLGCEKIHGMNDWDLEIVKKEDTFHGFVRAMEMAYFDHYPLLIKVSHIWLLILHGLSQHLDIYNAQLRSKYVNDGKNQTLTVVRDSPDFVFDTTNKNKKSNNDESKDESKNADWSKVIDEFCDQIDKNTKNDIAGIVENDFSVSTKLEQTISKVSLMAACKHC